MYLSWEKVTNKHGSLRENISPGRIDRQPSFNREDDNKPNITV
jgi:hypothetical protein